MLKLIRLLVKEGLVPTKENWIGTNGEDSSYPDEGYFETTQNGTNVNGFTATIKRVNSGWYSMSKVTVNYKNEKIYEAKSDSEEESFTEEDLKIYDVLYGAE